MASGAEIDAALRVPPAPLLKARYAQALAMTAVGAATLL